MSVARFILSLDCEGKWGVADHLTAIERERLTDVALRSAYSSILRLLDEFEIPATFAFVGAFSQSRTELARVRPELETLSVDTPYLSLALEALSRDPEGWHGGDLTDRVASAHQPHELALHGVTHVPWDSVGRGFAEEE